MSWLAANWYSVLALFAAPAMLGIAFWVIAHRLLDRRDLHDRARQARKLGNLQLSRTPHRR